ncbi:MAG: hypothetical protein HY754_13645, partial [Nitrospirae bacterium]|nr:hypothetical protein [Nitrospirota bacterium]
MSKENDEKLCRTQLGEIIDFIAEQQRLLEDFYEKNNCSDNQKRFKEGLTKECLRQSLQEVESELGKKYKDYEVRKINIKSVRCLSSQRFSLDTSDDTYIEEANKCRKYVENNGKEESKSFFGKVIGAVGLVAFIAAPFIPIAALGGSAISSVGSAATAGIVEGGIVLGSQVVGSTLAGVGSYMIIDTDDLGYQSEGDNKTKGFF